MNKLNYIEIGRKIKRKRKSLNLTQLELAEQVGITESSISKYESGKISTMPTSTVNKICHALRIKPSELLGLTTNNSFEYDLKEILNMTSELPLDIQADILEQLKSQIKLYWRLYNGKENRISTKIKD